MNDLTPRFSGSPNPDGGSTQPMDIDVTQDFANMSGQEDAGVLGSRTSDLGRPSHSLHYWYCNNGKDEPWVPLPPGSGAVRSAPRSAVVGSRNLSSSLRPLPHFSDYRSNVDPSECSTVPPGIAPSDSGYASAPMPSVGNPSVYGDHMDRSTEQNLVSQLTDFQFHSSVSPALIQPSEISGNYESHRGHTRSVWSQSGDSAQTPSSSRDLADRDAGALVCRWCQHTCKTRSEYKKHEQRHTKPHHCTEPGCHRTEGFSTANDLARHKRSLHPHSLSMGTRFFKCTLGNCKNKDKLWPRADNFRQHLKRVHDEDVGVDNLGQFTHRPPNNDLAGLGSAVQGDLELEAPGVGSDVVDIHSGWRTQGARPGPDRLAHIDTVFSGDSSLLVGNSFAAFSMPGDSPNRDRRGGSPEQAISHHARRSEQSPLPLPQATSQRSLPDGTEAESHVSVDSVHSVSEEQCIQPDVLSYGKPGTPTSEEKLRAGYEKPYAVVDLAAPEADNATYPGDEDNSSPSDALEPVDEDEESNEGSAEHPIELDTPGESETSLDTPPITVSAPGAQMPNKKEDDDEGKAPAATIATGSPSTGPAVGGDDIVNDETKASAYLQELHERGMLAKLIPDFGYQKSPITSKPRKQSPVVITHRAQTSRHTCSQCMKRFHRQCELKKHLKRHERPYSCTYPGCTKKFGSKSDWKRHENSQHLQLEIWRCDVLSADDGAPCHKVSSRRETFKAHLQREHGLQPKAVEDKLELCRVGQNCANRFWCGFCVRIIDVSSSRSPGSKSTDGKEGKDEGNGSSGASQGHGIWAERFDHIDGHYSGRSGLRKMDISEWKEPESGLPDAEASGPSKTDGSAEASPAERSSGDKRSRTSADGEENRRKRKKKTIVWFCCRCNGWNNVETTEMCMEEAGCSHRRCKLCATQPFNPNDHDDIGS